MFKIIKEVITYYRLEKYEIRILEDPNTGEVINSATFKVQKPDKKNASIVTEVYVTTQTLGSNNYHDVFLWATSKEDAKSKAIYKVREMRLEEQTRRSKELEKRLEEIEIYIDRVAFGNSEADYAFAAPRSLADSSLQELVFYYEKAVGKAVRHGLREAAPEWYREFAYLTMWLKDVIDGRPYYHKDGIHRPAKDFREFYDGLFQRRANHDGKYWRKNPAAVSVINMFIHDIGVILKFSPPDPLPEAEVDEKKVAEELAITRRLVVHT